VVLATSAKAAAFLTQNHESKLSTILKSVRMSSLMSVTVFFKSAQENYKALAALFPADLT